MAWRFVNGLFYKNANFFACVLDCYACLRDCGVLQMTEARPVHRGGRRPLGDPIRSFSINPRASEYAVLKDAAEKSGKTLSRFCVDAALKEAMGIDRSMHGGEQ